MCLASVSGLVFILESKQRMLKRLHHHSASQTKMQNDFKAAMLKMSIIGQNRANMVDCSDVIPQPPPLNNKPHLPAGLSMGNIEQAVRPSLIWNLLYGRSR
jgi:hypothetical protein